MKHILIPAIAISLAASAIMASGRGKKAGEANFDFTPANKLMYAERLIDAYYVDTVNENKIVDEAIVAMLKTLDPHSSYSDPEETRELTEPLEGNFSGIGIQFNMLNDTLFVIQTIAGGPGERVGILAGDRIIKADTTVIAGVKMPRKDIVKMLRGPRGTDVDLEVVRRGTPRPINFTITREDIPIYSVDAAYMADPTTGYIRVSRFAEDTDRELTEAMDKLRRQGMRNLILDLTDNGGGYLGAAFNMASHFLHKGDPVVYTEGPKMPTSTYDAEREGDFTDGRLVVMVNQYSASASEILSGAVQDNDRGIIVGRRTFGKGLVQRPFPFPDGSMIRLTVSRYHTPSGRCIQKPYTPGDGDDYALDMKRRYDSGEFSSADSIHFADSLRYETLRSRRTVYGGGGIMPDIFVPIDTTAYSDYYRDLVAKGVINKFAISHIDSHRGDLKREYRDEQSFIDRFNVTDAMLDEIVRLGKEEGVEPNAEQLQTSDALIRTIVKGLIARDIFEQGSYYRVVNPSFNPIYTEALKLINDPDHYSRLLAPAQ